ncbi:hypothetical protein MNODULE_06195 [Nitrospiraceae bacterium HYJII51-Mn-bac16s-1-B09]|uniref:Uncharacterized protein n=1 Tax=Candidatus Manganitrophus noduliformans TaxID=2606439 RepID=A0A7X6IAA4_9BACT|nr:hypothetical protein [Candidatus Manganitrophus noduliformans]
MLKVAVTDFAALIVTVQEVPAALSQPDQPAKIELAEGAAVSVIDVPLLKDAEQVAPQLIPAGLLVTVPVPDPFLATVRVKLFSVNVAVTDLAASMVTTQGPVPVQAPDHPVKSVSSAGAVVRVTVVAALKNAEQLLPQSMPAGEEVMVPVPLPSLLTVRE